ncbi:hypothetical protein BBJ28_00011685 [Nothophytophthora sp. Chile5]|nr:hypothetical protein BBJ28_00011685 [Nothophytophthora sp. Chile5]
MMFWNRGGSGKATSSAAADDASTSRRASPNQQIAVKPPVPLPPSYVLSEQRRNELLLAARTNRVSWVDGVDERHAAALAASNSGLSASLAAPGVPSHCREALEGVGEELSRFFAELDELKLKILANDMRLSEEEPDAPEDLPSLKPRHHTLFQELREQETRLDQWRRAHSPRSRRLTSHDREMAFLTGFCELVALLKNPQMAELVYRIQSFVKRAEQWDLPSMLKARAKRDRPGGRIQSFITQLMEQIRHSRKLSAVLHKEGPSRESGGFLRVGDEAGEDLLHEVLEAFLMEKLYAKTLTPSIEVARQDEALHDRISSLGFVTFEHLDLPVPVTQEERQTWEHLAQQLEAMTLCPSPRRKMDGVLRVSQDLTTLLKTQNGGKFPSADQFLPALIYLLLRANPQALKRNVAFIQEYRSPSKLVSEPGYFFTHIVSSVAFLEEVNSSSLTISPEEFEEGLQRSKQSLKLRRVRPELEQDTISNASSDSVGNSDTNTSALRGKQIPESRSDAISTEEDEEEVALRLPTVLEVRARRLALMAAIQ